MVFVNCAVNWRNGLLVFMSVLMTREIFILNSRILVTAIVVYYGSYIGLFLKR